MLTIQILIKNHENTIEKCIESLMPLKGKISIADIGCSDNTIKICHKYKIIPESYDLENFSQVRNQLIEKSSTHWQMYIEPYEWLVNGHDEINQICSSNMQNSFSFEVAQGTIITKEIRLWHRNLLFVNPVFETIKDKNSIQISPLIVCDQHKIDTELRLSLIEKWKKDKPTAIEPYYYQALTYLLKGKYNEFIGFANHYLFKESIGMSSVMLRYYLAMVQGYQLNDVNEACRNLLTCIAQKPLMAEFWCLLGDLHYKIKQYSKAAEFYENAIILGNRRLNSDEWPIDVSKYKEHPNKMIENIKSITQAH